MTRPHSHAPVVSPVIALSCLALAACGQASGKTGDTATEGEARPASAPATAASRIPPITPLSPEVAELVSGAPRGGYRVSTALAPGLNIIGIATGADLNAAADIALRHNPAFEVRSSSAGPGVEGVLGVTFGRSLFFSSPKESLLVSGAGLPGQEKVYAVHRYLNIREAPVALAQFETDLRQRFGNYVYRPNVNFGGPWGYLRYWGWTPEGQPVPPRGMNTGGMPIRRADGVVNHWYLDNCIALPNSASMSASAVRFGSLHWPSSCAVQVGVNWGTSSDNDQLVTQYLVSLYDPQTIAQVQAELTRHVQAAAARQQSRQIQEAEGRRAQF